MKDAMLAEQKEGIRRNIPLRSLNFELSSVVLFEARFKLVGMYTVNYKSTTEVLEKEI